MTRHNRLIVLPALVVAAVALAGLIYGIRAVRAAENAPSTETLNYAGFLEGADGPVTGTHNIQLYIYDAAVNGKVVCQSPTTELRVEAGRFILPIPGNSECSKSISAHQSTWIELLIDGSTTGRRQVGTVPYAIAASQAMNGVPAGAVVAFDLDVCPAGWSLFTPAEGRTVVGVGAERQRGDTFGTETSVLTVNELPPHSHNATTDTQQPRIELFDGYGVCLNEGYWTINWNLTELVAGGCPVGTRRGGGLQSSLIESAHSHSVTVSTTGRGDPIRIVPPSIALLYCKKDT